MTAPQHFTFADAAFADVVAHDGRGSIAAARVLERRAGGAGAAFVDLVVVPPGHSIGLHTHGDDEETYVIVEGTGLMEIDGALLPVAPGDVVVNRPGGQHGLDNTGSTPLRLVVIDVGGADRR